MEERERDFSFWGKFNDWIWPISKYLEFTTFALLHNLHWKTMLVFLEVDVLMILIRN